MEEQKQGNRKGFQKGSAFILAIVLTSLLAFIGMMFVTITRVDRIATSAIAENKALDGAVETVIAKISQQLILDTPGVNRFDPNRQYYDYPDQNDPWLASLEPYKDGNDYKWGQISDVTGFLDANGFSTEDVLVDPPTSLKYIKEYPKIKLDDGAYHWADADGDGIADSKWIRLDGVMTTKGEPIYAAVRVIDNGGMLNVNTAYQFDPDESNPDKIDGSSQTQIDLETLLERGTSNSISDLDDERYKLETGPNSVLSKYIENVVWRYDRPNGDYTPFDIGDELKLRNRYLINNNSITTRIELLWYDAYEKGPRTPLPTSQYNFDRWLECTINSVDPNDYEYKHISTTYNMDRIINPEGDRLVNVNTINTTADVESLYRGIKSCLNFVDANEIAAQIIANLIDYVDSNDSITDINSADVNDANLGTEIYYGFERPCVYISELAHKFYMPDEVNEPNIIYQSYAIELYKPYFEDNDPCDWRLVIDNTTIDVPVNWSGTRRFHVIYWENSNALISDANNFNDPNEPNDTDANSIYGYDPNDYDTPIAHTINNDSNEVVFDGNSVITLVRYGGSEPNLIVDSVVPDSSITNWLVKDGNDHSIQRDITPHKCIRRLWDTNSLPPTLGNANNYKNSDSIYIQAHPANSPFRNVGEIGMVFRKPAYYEDGQDPNLLGVIGYNAAGTENTVRIDLAEPNFQQLFNYLTVMDPYNHGNDANETRVKGRININTAPWFVIAQLPWVSQRKNNYDSNDLAQAIVAYRDKMNIAGGGPDDYSSRPGNPGFKNIGQLNNVVDVNDNSPDYKFVIDYYNREGGYAVGDQMGFPDLTGDDGAVDDFEERDLIFARISNLVTVRSDVFTAYILVRAGVDGAQKRVIAILDRSNVYPDSAGGVIGDVKIRALHPVPDPR